MRTFCLILTECKRHRWPVGAELDSARECPALKRPRGQRLNTGRAAGPRALTTASVQGQGDERWGAVLRWASGSSRKEREEQSKEVLAGGMMGRGCSMRGWDSDLNPSGLSYWSSRPQPWSWAGHRGTSSLLSEPS